MKSTIYNQMPVYFIFLNPKIKLKRSTLYRHRQSTNPQLTTDNLHLISHKTASARRKSLHLLKRAISNDSKNYQSNTANVYRHIN